MIRKLVSRTVLVGAVLFGLVAQGGSYLLAFTDPGIDPGESVDEAARYSASGPSAVGIRRLGDGDGAAPLVNVWYPASVETAEPVDPPLDYAYAISMLSPDSGTALATYPGTALPGAAFATPGPFPVVVLSHGFAIAPSSYAWLAEHLASYGLVVVAPQHRESLDPRALWKATVDRPVDIDLALATIAEAVSPHGEMEGLADLARVAVIGHSYGGYTALASAGARIHSAAFEASCDADKSTGKSLVFLCDALVPRLAEIADRSGLNAVPDGLWPTKHNHDVQAIVSLAGDAALFSSDGLAEVTVPMMTMGGTADIDAPFEWGTAYAYEHVSSERKVEVGLQGAGHFVFAGGCDNVRRILTLVSMGFCSGPAWDRARAQALAKHFVAAFLLAELNRDAHAATELESGRLNFEGVDYREEGYSR